MRAYGGVDVLIPVFYTSALVGSDDELHVLAAFCLEEDLLVPIG
jgi:hypothetical protein